MNALPAEFVDHPRDSATERDLVRHLRTLSEAARLASVEEVVRLRPVLGLSLAHRVLNRPASYERLLHMALESAGAGTMQTWMECVVPRLGFRRTLRLLADRSTAEPRAVEFALYWLPSFSSLAGYDGASVDALRSEILSRSESDRS